MSASRVSHLGLPIDAFGPDLRERNLWWQHRLLLSPREEPWGDEGLDGMALPWLWLLVLGLHLRNLLCLQGLHKRTHAGGTTYALRSHIDGGM